MKIYENVVIGNFLYGLGLNLGLRISKHRNNKENEIDEEENSYPSVINMLQQTPSDKLLGDMILEFPGVVRIIEFKNASNKSKKEELKIKKLNVALNGMNRYTEISREIHWYIETKPLDDICVNKIIPYIDTYSGELGYFHLETYIKSIIDNIFYNTSEITLDEIQAYIDLLIRTNGSGSIGTGGIIISTSKAGIHYAEFTDIRELRLQHKTYKNNMAQTLESVMKSELQHEKDLAQKKLNQNQNTRDYGYGPR